VKALYELYVQQFKTTTVLMLQYRAMLFIWMTWHIVEPLVYLVVWMAVSQSRGGIVGSYTTRGFASYFILMMLVNQLTYSWVMYEYEYRIREGKLSFLLLRPVHPIHSDIADNISSKLVTLPLMLMVALILSLIFRPEADIRLWAAAAFIPAILLAFMVRFLLDWTVAQAAFWTTRTSAVNQMYSVLVLFLSGQFAPLTLFPAPIRALAWVLPFRWTIGFPVELLLGRVPPGEALLGMALQVVWLGISFLLLKAVWRAGLKVYSAVGA
jgi:ABC-2 type transport system permease protein